MDEPGVPLLVRLEVFDQRMTVWAFLMGGDLVLGLFHCAAPPQKGVSVSTVARTEAVVHCRGEFSRILL